VRLVAGDYGGTFDARLANPLYQQAVENLCRRTGVNDEGDVRPLLFPVDGYLHEQWIHGEWCMSKQPMPLRQK
jgi:hypothetical protein